MEIELEPEEREALTKLGIVVFEGRILRDAQPPVDETTLEKIAARCSGPLPEGLVALWRAAFGGTLDYDLHAELDGVVTALSFKELFHPGSDGYRDLWGWIEHEEELADEAAEAEGVEWSGTLDYLPFGGFEYGSRLYVKVLPGRDHGAVFAWEQGLPPAWSLRLHHDATACIAPDIAGLFRMLAFDDDPRAPSDEFASGVGLVRAIEAIEDVPLREKLLLLVGHSILDWRAAVADGAIARDVRLRRLAFVHAVRTDDVALIQRLEKLGCPLDAQVYGGGTALDLALVQNAKRTRRFLLDRNLPVTNAIRNGASHASPELVAELLRRGAEPDAIAVMTAIAYGHLDGALLIARALVAASPSSAEELAASALDRAEQAERTADRIETRQMSSNRTADEHRAEARAYRRLAELVTS